MNTSDYSFDAILVSYSDSLRSFARNLTGNRAAGDDLFQETMVKALLYKDSFASHSNLKAWLYTIMRNVFINDYRKSKRWQKQSLSDIIIPGMVQELNSGLEYSEIQQEIARLDSSIREPFELYYAGYKYKEISDELALPIGTVKSRIYLARQELMKRLGAYA